MSECRPLLRRSQFSNVQRSVTDDESLDLENLYPVFGWDVKSGSQQGTSRESPTPREEHW